jgi:hypothetical protein
MTNNKQQTALEIFWNQLPEILPFTVDTATAVKLDEAYQQSKEMEKEQKKECWDVAHQAGRFEGKGIAEENWQTFEQYYNETYGGGDK